ncbi:MAG: glycoside hydrolase family 18 protein, partial [Proteobacteria bacterium]|nr:glycoside hydrolase family 18 protein [Pseudomonadota bacterium]
YPVKELEKLDFSQFEMLYYGFHTVDGSGNSVRDINEPLLKKMVEKAHAVGTKVILGFAGGASGTYDPDPMMDTLCSDTTKVKKFVSDLMVLMKTYDLDGIDNDWEPFVDPETKKEKYEYLMEVLRDSVDALEEIERIAFEEDNRGEVAFVGKILSAAVIASPWAADLYLSTRSLELMDYVLPMTYIYEEDSKKAYNEYLDYWLDTRKVPADKL